jgi:hypothetical protein
MSMRLFEDLRGRVVPTPEAKLVPEIKKIIARSKDNGLGELSYLYFMYDYRSPYATYSPDARKRILLTELNLPAKFQEDVLFIEARTKYLKFIETPTSKSMVSVKNGLDKMHRLVDILADEVEKSIVKLQAVEGEDEDEDDERQKLITRAVNNMNKILEISQVLPKNIASLQSLQEQIQKEQSTTTTVLGGGAVGAFED